jgi:hypothetical protein
MLNALDQRQQSPANGLQGYRQTSTIKAWNWPIAIFRIAMQVFKKGKIFYAQLYRVPIAEPDGGMFGL